MHYWPVVRGVADTRGHDLPVERRLIEIQTLIVFSPQQTSRNIIWIESLHHFTTPVTIEWIIVLLDWTNSKDIMPSKKLKKYIFTFHCRHHHMICRWNLQKMFPQHQHFFIIFMIVCVVITLARSNNILLSISHITAPMIFTRISE